MSKIQIIVDGSAGAKILGQKSGRLRGIGWGIVAHFNGTTKEISGFSTANRESMGYHEYCAFIEGMLLGLDYGFRYEDMSFYSDFHPIAYANMAMHDDNAMFTHRDRVLQSFQAACMEFYGMKIFRQVQNCLKHARISYMKGHDRFVEMNRADYLARYAMKTGLGLNVKNFPCRSFNDWIRCGYCANHADDGTRHKQEYYHFMYPKSMLKTMPQSNLLSELVGI